MPITNYGTTLDEVRDHIPHRRITATTKPSEGDVTRMMATVTTWVAVRFGPMAGVENDDAREYARGLVAMGTAAMAQVAGYPEGAERARDSYGQWLWEQFTEGLGYDPLEGSSEGGAPEPGEPETGPDAFPAVTATEPLFRRDMAW